MSSGEHVKVSAGAETSPPSKLPVAVAYWPGRWPRAIVVAGIALEPFVGALDARGWTQLLDRLAEAALPALVDTTAFAVDDEGPPSSDIVSP